MCSNMTSITAAKSPPFSAYTSCQSSSWIKNRNVFRSPLSWVDLLPMMQRAEAPGATLELQRHSMLTWTEEDPLLSSVQRPDEREGGMKEPGAKEYQEGIDG